MGEFAGRFVPIQEFVARTGGRVEAIMDRTLIARELAQAQGYTILVELFDDILNELSLADDDERERLEILDRIREVARG